MEGSHPLGLLAGMGHSSLCHPGMCACARGRCWGDHSQLVCRKCQLLVPMLTPKVRTRGEETAGDSGCETGRMGALGDEPRGPSESRDWLEVHE